MILSRFTLSVLLLFGLATPVAAAQSRADLGPAIGSRMPAFELTDHEGRVQSHQSLKGNRGLVLLFFRSADW